VRLKHRTVARVARKIGDQADRGAFSATWVRMHAEEIADRANADMDDAIASTSFGSRSSDPATPTDAKALEPADPVTRMVLALVRALTEADRLTRRAELELQNAERAGRWLLAMDPEKARNEAETYAQRTATDEGTKGSQCINPACQVYVARTAKDRLHGGRCDACRKHLERTGIERPAHLCALANDALGTGGLGLDNDRLIVEGVA